MPFLLDPSEYQQPNPRIDGWKKLREVNAHTVPVHVFPLNVFQHFLEKDELPTGFEQELKTKAAEIIKSNPSHTTVVRRAFVVPGLENPPGPRFLGLSTPEAVVEAVKNLYRFAIAQNFHQTPKNQISGWLEPPSVVLDEPQFQKDYRAVLIPYGGYAITQNGVVEIYAVLGINEGVQSLVTDRYLVEIRRQRAFILKKEIPQKNFMLCTTAATAAQLLPVPLELQFEQVLSDSEITETARVVHELSQKYGPQRVEFSTYHEGFCFNEVADYWKGVKTETVNLQVRGRILAVNQVADLDKLARVNKEELGAGKYIVLVGEHIITNRDYDVLGSLAAWKDNLYVLYPGIAATQHAMRILADKGHKAFLIGNQKFDEGDEAQIVVTGGKVRVTNLTRTENQQIVSLWDASLVGVDLCGGKADRLSKLKILGFQVPHGSVLTTALFEDILEKLGFRTPAKLEDFASLENHLKNPSPTIAKAIDELVTDYRNSKKTFAVRSSASIEDAARHSLAGLFETYLEVPAVHLTEKVVAVLRSTFDKRVFDFLSLNRDLVPRLEMAVVVQEMVPARVAGVIFGAKVQTGNADVVEIEANLGLGEGIVSGMAKAVEQYKFSRSEKRIVDRKDPTLLSAAEARALFLLSERLRSEFADIPQDIEWAIDQTGQIWVLQSRDLIF